jgi:poly-gamma-glutamate capsule biosynthesis protein CapA/YwtB (metallophosphatase superfamily)
MLNGTSLSRHFSPLNGLNPPVWCDALSRMAIFTLSLLLVLLSGCQAGNPSPAPTVTLALLGDVMLGRGVHTSAQTFAYLEPTLKSADFALANLESPLTHAPIETTSKYQLCAAPENVRYLVDAGFDLLSLANNHRFDCGEKGLAETQSTLTKAGLGFIGTDSQPVYRQINGVELAFLAFDATNGLNIEAAEKAVRAARETGVVVIVSLHWGMEYQSAPSLGQKQIAEKLSEAGAALIWGQHPHVLQRAEWVDNGKFGHGETENGKTLALYSLGNALFDQAGLANTRQSALALVTLDKNGVTRMRVIPFVIDVPNSKIIEADTNSAKIILEYFK